jgi:hypothetical protein
VSNARAGAVTQDRTGSDSAIYRCAEVAPNTIMVVDSRGRSATVAITVPTTAQALAIIPSSHTLTAAETTGLPLSIHGDTVQFHAVGGVPPYGPWRAASPSLGTINAAGVYTVNGTSGLGQNTVSITDSAGHVATATVTTKLNQ